MPEPPGQHHREAAAGWEYSASAYVAFQDRGDLNRTLLLDPVMLEQCGEVARQRVLDLGSGEGRFCRMLADRGARPTGIDLTPELVRIARDRRAGSDDYVRGTAECLPFADASFDIVISYITLVDIVDFHAAITESARVLTPGGRMVAANLGFVTASQGWLKDDDGNRLYHRVDRYAEEFSQVYEWEDIRITNWHRPLAAYMSAYLEAGLELRAFLEPVPEDQSLRTDPYFEDWFRVPLCNVMTWQKPAV